MIPRATKSFIFVLTKQSVSTSSIVYNRGFLSRTLELIVLVISQFSVELSRSISGSPNRKEKERLWLWLLRNRSSRPCRLEESGLETRLRPFQENTCTLIKNWNNTTNIYTNTILINFINYYIHKYVYSLYIYMRMNVCELLEAAALKFGGRLHGSCPV